ncbi:MAG TPA: iron-containing alcohol dehydrogenase [Gaiellaceae bacterium]|nr:iron-containing alcohol dehydrogenase [Gaiellaceae bacterium]
MIVRWGPRGAEEVLAELGVSQPYLLASPRHRHLPAHVGRWSELPTDDVAAVAAEAAGADALVAVGGGSAIDTGKAVSAETGLPLVSVPTTYSGAEWTPFFGIRDRERRQRGGGAGARLGGIAYDPERTLDLPRAETVGTALNALAHCAEALYVQGRNDAADEEALAGARLIGGWLPEVVERPRDLEARTELLRGACHGGAALAGSMLALGHAMAQALGGRYGLPHGAMNALCLPPALRFNAVVAPDAVARLAEALGAEDAATRVEELARLGGFGRLRDLGVPEEELDAVAAAVVERPGAKANPRPATPGEVAELLRSIW